jgi:transcriptional regulator with XRE-family HTH domain
MTPLKRIRTKKKFTQQYVADHVGVNQSTILRIERGEVWPERETLEKLVSFFDGEIKVEQILFPKHKAKVKYKALVK